MFTNNQYIIYTEGTEHVVDCQGLYHYRDPEHTRWMPIGHPKNQIIVCFMFDIDALKSNFLVA